MARRAHPEERNSSSSGQFYSQYFQPSGSVAPRLSLQLSDNCGTEEGFLGARGWCTGWGELALILTSIKYSEQIMHWSSFSSTSFMWLRTSSFCAWTLSFSSCKDTTPPVTGKPQNAGQAESKAGRARWDQMPMQGWNSPCGHPSPRVASWHRSRLPTPTHHVLNTNLLTGEALRSLGG